MLLTFSACQESTGQRGSAWPSRRTDVFQPLSASRGHCVLWTCYQTSQVSFSSYFKANFLSFSLNCHSIWPVITLQRWGKCGLEEYLSINTEQLFTHYHTYLSVYFNQYAYNLNRSTDPRETHSRSHRSWQWREGRAWAGCAVFSQQAGCAPSCRPHQAQSRMPGAQGSALAVGRDCWILESVWQLPQRFPHSPLERASECFRHLKVYFVASGNQRLWLLPFATLTPLERPPRSSAWQLQTMLTTQGSQVAQGIRKPGFSNTLFYPMEWAGSNLIEI